MNDWIIEMVEYVNAMIDNADAYEGDDNTVIWRYTPPGQYSDYLCVYEDIDDIAEIADKCIAIIDKHADMPK